MRLLGLSFTAILLAVSAATGATVTVNIENFMFSPSDVTIASGDTVHWVWVSGLHSTTSDTTIWDSNNQSLPFVFDVTFNTPGDFRYYCRVHGAPGGIGMTGMVHVIGVTPTPTRTPTPTATSTPTVTGTPTVTRTPTPSPVPTPRSFHSLAPCRLADTRDPAGPYGGPALAAGAERLFTVPGRCGVPVGAAAVSLNMTVTQPTDDGHLRLYPGGTIIPLVSSINYRAGQTRANNATLPLGVGGSVAVFCAQGAGSVQLILDVNGYYQ